MKLRRQHEHRWAAVGHESLPGPYRSGGAYGYGLMEPSPYAASHYLIRACECGEVRWDKYDATEARRIGTDRERDWRRTLPTFEIPDSHPLVTDAPIV